MAPAGVGARCAAAKAPMAEWVALYALEEDAERQLRALRYVLANHGAHLLELYPYSHDQEAWEVLLSMLYQAQVWADAEAHTGGVGLDSHENDAAAQLAALWEVAYTFIWRAVEEVADKRHVEEVHLLICWCRALARQGAVG